MALARARRRRWRLPGEIGAGAGAAVVGEIRLEAAAEGEGA